MKTKNSASSANFTYWLSVIIVGIVLGLTLQFVRAWTEPTQAPPNGNVGAPINTGNPGQYKQGGLMINTGGALNGLLVPNGNVGIGTKSPGAKLDVQGGSIKATGGLIIETRASNPASPVNGQMWLIVP